MQTIIFLYDTYSLSIICDEFYSETYSFSASLAKLTFIEISRTINNSEIPLNDKDFSFLLRKSVNKVFKYLIENFPRKINFTVDIEKIEYTKYRHTNIKGIFSRIAYYNVMPRVRPSSDFTYCVELSIMVKYTFRIPKKLLIVRRESINIVIPIRYYLIKVIIKYIENYIKDNACSIILNSSIKKLKKILKKYKYIDIEIKYRVYNKKLVIEKILVKEYFPSIYFKKLNINVTFFYNLHYLVNCDASRNPINSMVQKIGEHEYP